MQQNTDYPHRELRTCLYEGEGINLKEALRSGKTDQELKDIIISSIQHKPKDGWEAEKSNFTSSQNPSVYGNYWWINMEMINVQQA